MRICLAQRYALLLRISFNLDNRNADFHAFQAQNYFEQFLPPLVLNNPRYLKITVCLIFMFIPVVPTSLFFHIFHNSERVHTWCIIGHSLLVTYPMVKHVLNMFLNRHKTMVTILSKPIKTKIFSFIIGNNWMAHNGHHFLC